LGACHFAKRRVVPVKKWKDTMKMTAPPPITLRVDKDTRRYALKKYRYHTFVSEDGSIKLNTDYFNSDLDTLFLTKRTSLLTTSLPNIQAHLGESRLKIKHVAFNDTHYQYSRTIFSARNFPNIDNLIWVRDYQGLWFDPHEVELREFSTDPEFIKTQLDRFREKFAEDDVKKDVGRFEAPRAMGIKSMWAEAFEAVDPKVQVIPATCW
jgi:hypothetical protein